MANAYTEYFANQLKYTQIHGRLTIFFTQCGMFFESYETLEDGYDLQILSSILNISLTRKDKSIPVSNKNPYMLGFPCTVATKFIKILIESGYTIVIEEQVSPAPKPKRAVTGIYSPSTFLNEISPTILLDTTCSSRSVTKTSSSVGSRRKFATLCTEVNACKMT